MSKKVQQNPNQGSKSHKVALAAPKGSSKPLPPIPAKTLPKSPPKKKEKLEYKKSLGREWWNNTGDLLYDLGSKAFQHGLSLLTGFGDYTLESNSLVAAATRGSNGSAVPIMENSKVANIIRHREYIGDIYGSTSPFLNRKFSINPGLDGTFPWLAPTANSYTNYRMRGAAFQFVSLATEYSAVPYIGFVAMATQYNALDLPFTDKKSMENSEYANSCKPSEDLLHPIECSEKQLALHELYVRNVNSLPTNSDLRMYDMGTFNIAVGGQASETIIGELWLTYEIELFYPKLSNQSTVNSNCFMSDFSSWVNGTPLGNLPLIGRTGSTLELYSYNSNTVILPSEAVAQTFYVTITYFGSTTTVTAPTVTGVNSTISRGVAAPQNTTGITSYIVSFMMKIDTGNRGGFSLSGGSYPIYLSTPGTLLITQVPPQFSSDIGQMRNLETTRFSYEV